MSVFYPNNLMNGFVHKFNSTLASSPLCPCQLEVQTPMHLLTTCTNISADKRKTAEDLVEEIRVGVEPHHPYKLQQKQGVHEGFMRLNSLILLPVIKSFC